MRAVIRANRTAGVTMMKSICHLGAAALAVALFATAASAAGPGDKPAPRNTSTGTATPAVAPDGGLGMAILAARVQSDASIIAGSGTTGTIKLSTGTYEVDFNRDVSACFYSAIGFSNSVPLFVEPRAGNVNGVFLVMQSLTGTSTDSQFYLTVYCGN